MSIRINRYLSESGFCSRREADLIISEGRVDVNNQKAELHSRVERGDVVLVDGERIIPSRAVDYNPMPAPKSRPKPKVEPNSKVDKLPKWLVELRKKHGNYEEPKPVPAEQKQQSANASKPKPKRRKTGSSSKHTPKKSFNN